MSRIVCLDSLINQTSHHDDCLKAAATTLKGVAGVYAIIHTASGKVYLGSSSNIGIRIMAHLVYGSSNPHLQNALALYGLAPGGAYPLRGELPPPPSRWGGELLACFTVALVQEYFLDPSITGKENAVNLSALEQYWLDWLFSLDAKDIIS